MSEQVVVIETKDQLEQYLAKIRDSYRDCRRCGLPNELAAGCCTNCGWEFEDEEEEKRTGIITGPMRLEVAE